MNFNRVRYELQLRNDQLSQVFQSQICCSRIMIGSQREEGMKCDGQCTNEMKVFSFKSNVKERMRILLNQILSRIRLILKELQGPKCFNDRMFQKVCIYLSQIRTERVQLMLILQKNKATLSQFFIIDDINSKLSLKKIEKMMKKMKENFKSMNSRNLQSSN